jgi:Tol biopolymer transport system component
VIDIRNLKRASLAAAALLLAATVPAWAGSTERINVSSSGAQANNISYLPAISGDGRFVAFTSDASNLVPGDTNGLLDVFVRDRLKGNTERVSVSSSGAQGGPGSYNGNYNAAISGNGRFVAFGSDIPDLVPGNTGGEGIVYLHDRRTGRTERVDVGPRGRPANGESFADSLSADGRFVAFYSSATNLVDGASGGVFIRDRLRGRTELVPVGDGDGEAALSADGRYVAFTSYTNLVPGDTNSAGDIFVRDRRLGTTERVSVSSSGVQGNSDSSSPSISADGHVVAFESCASNLVPHDTNGHGNLLKRCRVEFSTSIVPGLDVFVHTR